MEGEGEGEGVSRGGGLGGLRTIWPAPWSMSTSFSLTRVDQVHLSTEGETNHSRLREGTRGKHGKTGLICIHT